jgi:hypothetical protein
MIQAVYDVNRIRLWISGVPRREKSKSISEPNCRKSLQICLSLFSRQGEDNESLHTWQYGRKLMVLDAYSEQDFNPSYIPVIDGRKPEESCRRFSQRSRWPGRRDFQWLPAQRYVDLRG